MMINRLNKTWAFLDAKTKNFKVPTSLNHASKPIGAHERLFKCRKSKEAQIDDI